MTTLLKRELLPVAINVFISLAEKKIEKAPISALCLMALHSFSEFFSFYQPQIIGEPVNSDPIPINMYSLLFMKSGGGKDSTINFMRSIFGETLRNNERILDEIAEKKEKELIDEAKLKGLKGNVVNEYVRRKCYRPLRSYYQNSGTAESLMNYARSAEAMGLGALNFVFPEFIDELKKKDCNSFLSAIKDAYDSGRMAGKSTKSQQDESPSKVTINWIAYTTLEHANKRQEAVIREELRGGFGRRVFMLYPTDDEYRKSNAYDHNSAMAVQEHFDIMKKVIPKYIPDLQQYNLFTLSIDARKRLKEYKISCEDAAAKICDVSNSSMKTELETRYWKAMKLSGILHLTKLQSDYIKSDREMKTTIQLDTLESAIYLTDYFGEHYQRFCTKTSSVGDSELLYNFLKDNINKEYSLYDIARQNFFSFDSDKIEKYVKNNMGVLYDMAMQDGNEFVLIKKGKSMSLSIQNTNAMQDVVEMSFSTNENDSVNFVPKKIQWADIPENVCSKVRYSPFTFVNNKRNQANSLKTLSVLVLDVDGGLSIDDCVERLGAYTFHIIPTKSHRQPKDGIIADRYRIFISLNGIYTFKDNNQYKNTMSVVAKILNIPDDNKCREVARMFYPSPDKELAISGLGRPFNLSECINDYAETGVPILSDSAVMPYQESPVNINDFKERIKNWLDSNFVAGNRNCALYSAKWWGYSGFLMHNEIKDFLMWYNANSSNPLPQNEMMLICREEKHF